MVELKNLLVSTPRLYKIAIFLSLIGIFLAAISFVIPGKKADTFWPLFFYFPVLWSLWICCAFFVSMERRVGRLTCLWLLIDIGILIFFLSCSAADRNWIKSQGAEMVLMLTFFPIVFPAVFFIAALPNNIGLNVAHLFDGLKEILGNGFGGVASFWLEFTLIGLIQSLILCVAITFFLVKRKSPFISK